MKGIDQVTISVHRHIFKVIVTVPSCRTNNNRVFLIDRTNSIDSFLLYLVPLCIRNTVRFVEHFIVKIS